MILAIAQSGQPGEHRGEVAGIAGFKIIEKLLHGAPSFFRFIELYGEFHGNVTSNLV
jgi:hypothetical protein